MGMKTVETDLPDPPAVDALLFFVVGSVLVVFSVTGYIFSFSAPTPEYALTVMGMSTVLLLAGAFLLVWPARLRAHLYALTHFPEALRQVENRLGELNQFRRELNKPLTAIDALHTQVQEEARLLEQLLSDKAAWEAQLTQYEDILGGERQEKGNLNRELEAWSEAAIKYFRSLESLLKMDGLPPEQKTLVEKQVNTLEQIIGPLGLEVIRPGANDLFNEHVHRIVGEEQATEFVEPDHIFRCTSWGFRKGATVLQSAEVVLAEAPPAIDPGVANPDDKGSGSELPPSGDAGDPSPLSGDGQGATLVSGTPPSDSASPPEARPHGSGGPAPTPPPSAL